MHARSGAATRRILHRYRKLVLLGRASLPLDAARRLMGPDCAYHLYFRSGGVRTRARRAAARGRRGPRSRRASRPRS